MGKTRKRVQIGDDGSESALYGDVNLGDGELLRAAVSRIALGLNEKSRRKHFEKAWSTYEDIQVVFTLAEMKLAFLNSRLSIKATGLPKGFDLSQARREWINDWVEDVCRRRIVHRSVVSIWGNGVTPTNLPVERCELKSVLGQDTVTFEHGYKASEVPVQWREAFRKPTINLSEVDGIEHLFITDPSPKGFGAPPLWRAQMVADQFRHMEIGENLGGFLSRTIVRHHKLGHEIKNGPRAGRDDHFWNAEWSALVKKNWSKNGFLDATGRFDHEVKWETIDNKVFDSRKWESPINRLLWWSGPLGFMFVAKSLNPFLMLLLREEIQAERERIGAYVSRVLESFLGLQNTKKAEGVKVQVGWSNRCFSDPRLALESVKFLTQQGPLSLTTALEETGFDAQSEAVRKEDEAKAPDARFLPKFDANHGAKPGDKAGRKPGTPDPHTA